MRTHFYYLLLKILPADREDFTEFHTRYFNSLVNQGILLSDIDYENIAYSGRRKITNSAYRLWKSLKYPEW